MKKEDSNKTLVRLLLAFGGIVLATNMVAYGNLGYGIYFVVISVLLGLKIL